MELCFQEASIRCVLLSAFIHYPETGRSILQRACYNKWFWFSLAFVLCVAFATPFTLCAQKTELENCNVTWTSQSKNPGESMPCGGGDIGLNVWVENGEVFFYIAKSGTFDENNAMLKLGRVRLKLLPNPFEGSAFKQELILKDGYVKISGAKKNLSAQINIWVDVFAPVIHVDISGNKRISAEATYESWRYADKPSSGKANNANSWKWAPQGEVTTYKDEIDFNDNNILFYHRNKSKTVFDAAVKQQGMETVKDQLYDPLKDLTFGGEMEGTNMTGAGNVSGNYIDTDFKGWKLKSNSPSRSHKINIYLHTQKSKSGAEWQTGLQKIISLAKANDKLAWSKTKNWWEEFWNRSFIFIVPRPDLSSYAPGAPPQSIGLRNPDSSGAWQAGRNYQLFRYMLASNEFGTSPTKFNGGLFTYDPSLTDSSLKFTPDFRNWGGGTFTAQNQRLVYWPMLKGGDFEMMKPAFNFYNQLLKNAELRSQVYWNHNGASFTEQLENFGLPNPAEYGWNRAPSFDRGVEYNAWLEYEWDTVLEFCFMILETERYANADIKEYIPFIESCITFFDEHYQFLARQRGRKALDSDGHLILFPGSAAETFKMAYNSTSTIAGLKTIITRLLLLPENYIDASKRKSLDSLLRRIPPIAFSEFSGHKIIAPAKLWERINNTESPQLYPVFPWGMYGVGKAGLDIATNTYKYDTNAVKFRSYVGWKQDNIFAARLGITEDAANMTVMKLKNSGRRFPAFWGPGFDWAPDFNWGGSGIIGLQEMLLQTDDKKIYLFAAWPKDWDVHFKLHAPYQTTVEAVVKNGRVEMLKVTPESRKNDVINMF